MGYGEIYLGHDGRGRHRRLVGLSGAGPASSAEPAPPPRLFRLPKGRCGRLADVFASEQSMVEVDFEEGDALFHAFA